MTDHVTRSTTRLLDIGVVLQWVGNITSLLLQTFYPQTGTTLLRYFRRVIALVVLAPFFVALQVVNLLCLCLDLVLFPAFKRVRPLGAIFIVGVPRSGTTFTHHLLDKAEETTSVRFWEALFAPSITQRYFFCLLGQVDQKLGGLGLQLLKRLDARLFNSASKDHPFSFFAPEEDFLLLLPTWHCFILIVAFPSSPWLWQWAKADNGSYRWHHQHLRFYYSMVQRHLYFHGQSLRYLAKNPSYSGIVSSIFEQFNDSHVLICQRDRTEAINSQYRVLTPILTFFGVDINAGSFTRNLNETLNFYESNLDLFRQRQPQTRWLQLCLSDVIEQPGKAYREVIEWLQLFSGQVANDESELPVVVHNYINTASGR